MSKDQTELEIKARGITSDLTKQEGRRILELLLERSHAGEIVEVIQAVKLDYEVKQISSSLLQATGF